MSFGLVRESYSKHKMIRSLLTLSIAAALTGCGETNKNPKEMEEQKNDTVSKPSANDTTPKVTGIGGIFFFSENPKETREWYSQNLGLETNDYGSGFETRNLSRPDEVNTLQWTPFKKGSEYFAPSKKEFMINYTVQNIEALVSQLKEKGVTVLDTIATYDYGKFVHILDPDGNKIELWEPVPETRSIDKAK
ncbi:MAG: Glyoxalase-like domain protein [Bacteroidetes bacterium]|nr:Glyoxalase-like domain protein [Bacteroidota bacterium]